MNVQMLCMCALQKYIDEMSNWVVMLASTIAYFVEKPELERQSCSR